MNRKAVLLGFSSLAAMVPAVASAQSAPEDAQQGDSRRAMNEIIVTAQKTATTLQDTPVSIVAMSGDSLNEQGKSELRDVLDQVAGVNFSSAAYGTTNINMRGVEGITAAQGKTDPAVAVYFDGSVQPALLGDPGTGAFYDIQRVEVLRGPQGTLYGRGAAAGVLNVVTNNPEPVLGGGATLEAGNYSLVRGSAFVNVPMTDTLAVRVAGQRLYREGFYTSGGNAADVLSVRGKLQYDSGAGLRILVGGQFTNVAGPLSIGGSGTGVKAWALGDAPDNPYDDLTKDGGVTGQVPGSTQDDDFYKVWGEIEADLGFGTLTVIPAYNKVSRDRVLAKYSSALGAYNYAYYDNTIYGDSKSFEARLASNGGGMIDWLAGFYYDTADSDYLLGEFSRTISQGQSSIAGFASVTGHITDAFSLTGGLRYTEDKKDFVTTRLASGAVTEGEDKWTHVDWRIQAQYDISPDNMVYASVATGYRPGGIDTAGSEYLTDLDGNTFPNPSLFSKAEYLTNFEIGTKNQIGNTLTLNLSAYFTTFKNRQYNYFTTTADPDAPCPNGAAPQLFGDDVVCSQLTNAKKVEIYGLEGELAWQPTDYDHLQLSFAYLSSKGAADEEVALSIPPGSTVPDGADVEGSNIVYQTNGKTLPQAPKLQVNASYKHGFQVFGGVLSLGGGVRYSTKYYMNGFNYLSDAVNSDGVRVGDLYIQPSYTQFDLNADFKPDDGPWWISAYMRNVSKEIVKSNTDGSNTQVEPPRTYGVTFGFKF
ncbi:TonB-dependent receptor [Novosphingobium profundi]|uniref:TonB-dependent receptor n=1 Tax=Novosphingobium profundi TaxID=1774954 RepID=UPI001BD96BF9|nr:TonB-dependent receptor [Novosphingobium profundi]MBT0670459.1 TonB-dependent receptor [Novosphingobium profundi]